MPLDQTSTDTLARIYSEFKFWGPLVGAMWAVFNGINYVKSIKENDLHHIQDGVSTMKEELSKQTTQVVGELKELRGDFKLLTTALIAPPLQRAAARARKKK